MFQEAFSLSSFGHIICIIDALDEFDPGEERDEFFATLEAVLCRRGEGKLTLILFNRDYWELSFENINLPKQSITHISLDKEYETQEDLKAFTIESVESLIRRRPTYVPYKTCLIDQIYERASDGMFLMVNLIVDLLYRSTDSSPRGVDHTIKTLPSTLQEVYRRIWDSIDPSKKLQASAIMGWMVATFQPVAVPTLADALAHELLLKSEDNTLTLDDLRSRDPKGDLKRLFGPLVWIDDQVELAHQTVKEFFLLEGSDFAEKSRMPSLLPEDTHIKIAATCLFCLTRNSNPKFNDASSIDTMLGVKIPPFYAYARRYCMSHFEAALEKGED